MISQTSENPLRTRADVTSLLEMLSAPLPAYATPGRAGLRLGVNKASYGDEGGLLEAYARPLWGWVPGAIGGGVSIPWSQWREGLDHGTDPDHPEFWGWAGDCDQRLVETPIIALGLALAPEFFWEPLLPEVRARVVAWISRINHVRVVDNNWHFFRILVNIALRRLGESWSGERLDADLRRIDEFYLGDGWYADGEERRGDYYVPMAMHFYGLLYTQLAGASDVARATEWRNRATRFAADFQHWFAADGAAVPFGRSLTYRFAQGAFWGALAFANVEALPWGVIKGLYLRHLRWWMKQPIFSEGGLLTIGYQYPNLMMAENYNAPGSPYWAFKVFLPLALPQTHPFWQEDEVALPARPEVLGVPAAGLVLTCDPAARHVVALNAGQPVTAWPRHAAQKYSKIAYSTAFAFSISAGGPRLFEGGFDSTLALSDDGDRFRTREHCLDARIDGGQAYSCWQPWPDVEVCTWLFALPHGHLRVHHLKSNRPLWSAETGFAVGRPACSETSSGIAICQGKNGGSGLIDLLRARLGSSVELEPNTNLALPLTVMPVLRGEHSPGDFWLACFAGGWLDEPTAFVEANASLVCEGGIDGLRVHLNKQPLFVSP